MNVIHLCTCTDERLLTVDFKHPKVMRINQACEVTDHATNFRLKIVTSTLEKLRSASAFWKLRAFQKAGSFVQAFKKD